MNSAKCKAIALFVLVGCFGTNLVVAQSVATVVESIRLPSDPETTLEDGSLVVKSCNDFGLTGKGTDNEWYKTEWHVLTKLDKDGANYETKFKILYSATGIYVLFHGEDERITTLDYKDFDNIFKGDVFEVFFDPDPKSPVYFEYEVNQLDKELILTISSLKGQNNVSWIPWFRSGIKKMVEIGGGIKAINTKIIYWKAEIFFPYGALGLMPNVPPKSGSVWNANFCRLDYDTGNMVKWSWSPTIVTSFHELEKFRSIKFE